MLVRIDQFKVVDSVEVHPVPHVYRKNRQSVLWRITSFSYPPECIDCKRMSQRVRCRGADVGVAYNLSGLGEPDLFSCLVEIVANTLGMSFGGIVGQEIWVLIIHRQQGLAKLKIVRQIVCHVPGDGD